MPTAEKFAVIQPVLKDGWEALSQSTRDVFARATVLGAAAASPQVDTVLPETFEYEVFDESTVDGIRFPREDEDGNPLAELVFIRGWVYASRKEATDG